MKQLIAFILISSPLFAGSISGGTATTATQGVLSGGYGRDFWFVVKSPSVSPRITGSVATQVPYRDRIYKRDSVSVVTDYSANISYELDRKAFETITVSSSDPLVLAVGSDLNSWTYVSSGTAVIQATSTSLSVSRPVVTSATTQLTSQFYQYGSNSVAGGDASFIDAALVGKSSTNSLALFSIRNDADSTYVRNVNCWASAINLTCSSVWNSARGSWFGATLISPRHVVFANHAASMNGATLRFVTWSNSVITRTVVATQYAASDVTVGILDSDVPSEITYATVIASTGTNKLAIPTESEWVTYPEKLPVIALNQFKQATVCDWVLDEMATSFGPLSNFRKPTDAQRSAFNVATITGDSGCPLFIVVNGHPVLISLWWVIGGGPAYRYYNTQINAAMHALSVGASAGTDYQLTTEDLSGFTSY